MGSRLMTPQETAHAIALIVGAPMLASMMIFRERPIQKPSRTHTGKITRQRVKKHTHNKKGTRKP